MIRDVEFRFLGDASEVDSLFALLQPLLTCIVHFQVDLFYFHAYYCIGVAASILFVLYVQQSTRMVVFQFTELTTLLLLSQVTSYFAQLLDADSVGVVAHLVGEACPAVMFALAVGPSWLLTFWKQSAGLLGGQAFIAEHDHTLHQSSYANAKGHDAL